jgi:hypothetical protein
LVDAKHATAFARRGADTPCEFGKIIGRAKDLVGVLPILLVNGIIEFRDHISQGASVVTKGYPAVHAAGSLLIELLVAVKGYEFIIIILPLLHGTFGG